MKEHEALRIWMEGEYNRTGLWPSSIQIFDFANQSVVAMKQRINELEKDCEILQTNLDFALKQVRETKGDLRDEFAKAALNGICASGPGPRWTSEMLAREAYDLSDAMIAERNASTAMKAVSMMVGCAKGKD